jgi:tetratricopeptide (TPR) repeat protein
VHLLVIVAALAVLHADGLQPHTHSAPSTVALNELVNRPVPLRTGIGSAHDAVSTSSTHAQAFYDQGLAYLHSFVWLEAARSFNQALRADPTLAMAHLGLTIAYTELNAPEAARTALERARALGASAGDHPGPMRGARRFSRSKRSPAPRARSATGTSRAGRRSRCSITIRSTPGRILPWRWSPNAAATRRRRAPNGRWRRSTGAAPMPAFPS